MRLLLVLALPLAFALTACGGADRATTTRRSATEKKACFPNVYFASHATQTQEQVVGAKLRRDPRVKRVEFTSKAQALAEMKKKFPQIYKTIPKLGNPLPASFTIFPVTRSDLRQTRASIARAGWPGVATIRNGLCPRRA